MGKDNNIDGDNTVIFTVSPLATGIKFNPDNNDVTFQEGMGTYTYYDYVPTTVSSDHYGACELRQNLLSIADSSRFTATEKSLMQATTLNMWDTLNSDSYTVSDKLYVPGGGYGDLDIKIGTFDKIILPMRTFWNNSQDSAFWLRTADTDHALIAVCGDKVGSRYFESAENVCAVRAASNLNLSSVLFASSATAFYSQTDEAKGTVYDGTAMTLRLDGGNKDIGFAAYDAGEGKIIAKKGKCSGRVVLMVQGNDGGSNWFYCSPELDSAEYVCTSSYIKEALNLSEDIDLSKCHIWLETKEDDMAYAVNAISGKVIDRIDATINAPKGEEKFDTDIKCNTEGIADAAITWTDIQGNSCKFNGGLLSRLSIRHI